MRSLKVKGKEVTDPIKVRVHEELAFYLKDNCQSWELQPDGSYVRPEIETDAFSCHDYFISNPSLSGLGSLAQDS